jgi:hypothetical protein
MRAKPDLTPDCDVHGEPMYKTECPASVLGMDKRTDITFWSCSHRGCSRYFHGTLGYRYLDLPKGAGSQTPRCSNEGAYMVVQRALGSYICPVAGCKKERAWQAPEEIAVGVHAA